MSMTDADIDHLVESAKFDARLIIIADFLRFLRDRKRKSPTASWTHFKRSMDFIAYAGLWGQVQSWEQFASDRDKLLSDFEGWLLTEPEWYPTMAIRKRKTFSAKLFVEFLDSREPKPDKKPTLKPKPDKPKDKPLTGRALRFAILTRDGFKCRYCGRGAADVSLQVDHIVPKSKGGTDTVDNYITACHDCNAGKSDVLLFGKTKQIKVNGGQLPSLVLLGIVGNNGFSFVRTKRTRATEVTP